MKSLKPGMIANMELKNRFVMAPMCMYEATEDGFVMPFHLIHYPTRAYGGVGLIIQEATAIEPRGRISKHDLGIWSDEHINGLVQLVNQVHLAGSKIGVQLAHAGRKCLAEGEKIIAPSSIPFNDRYPSPTEMDETEIKTVVKAFQEAALRAVKAGYDLIEIHGAHGYLINQFLSPLANKRKDSYGGSSENRHRFLFEVIQEVRRVWKGPLSLRLSAEEYAKDGNHIQDTLELVKKLNHQVDIINVSSGGVVPVPYDVFPGYQIAYAKAIKQLGQMVIGGGLITNTEEIEQFFHNHSIDFVYLGRELIRNPYFVLKAAKDSQKMEFMLKAYERGF